MNIIGDIELVDSIADFGTSPALNGALGVAKQTINGVTYVYVAGRYDNGIQVFTLANDGTLTPTSSAFDSTSYGLYQVRHIKTVQVGSEFFLLATSENEDAVTVFRLDDDGEGTDGDLVHVDTYFNSPGTGGSTEGAGVLDIATTLDTVKIAGTTYVAVAGYASDAISIYSMAPNGELTQTDVVYDADDADYHLDSVYRVSFQQIGNKTFVYAFATAVGQGISIFEVSSAGLLTNISNIPLASNIVLSDAVFADHNGQRIMVAVDTYTDRLVVYTVGADGGLTFLSQTPNDLGVGYAELWAITVADIGGVSFFFVTDTASDAVLVLSLDDSDVPQIVQTFSDPLLDYPRDVEVQQMGDRYFALVSGFSTDSLAVFEIGAGEDALVGTMTADKIVGLNGADDLLGRAGNDLLKGLDGDDVLSGHRGNDTLLGGRGFDVIMGGDGNDRVEGGADADVLIGGRGVDMLTYATSSGGVTIDLLNGTAARADAAGDIFSGFEQVQGSTKGDVLRGNNANNLLSGLKGWDMLVARGGNDTVEAGDGNDTVLGGGGNDTLKGGGGHDRMFGDNGNDRMIGGTGNDYLKGGAGHDTLIAGNGNDTLEGTNGDDSMTSGAGEDVFIFRPGSGNDIITDFNIANDVLRFVNVGNMTSLADFNAAAITFSGSTVVLVSDTVSITLDGVTESQFTADNFLFV